MKLIRLAVAVFAVTAMCTCASAEIISWAGFNWDTQPWAGFTAGSTSVDGDTGFLFQNPAGTPKSDIPFPGLGLGGERYSVAKLATGISGITKVYGRVFENSYRTQGPSLYLKSDTGQILSVGVRPSFEGTTFAYYMINYYDGAVWTNVRWITRGRNTYNNYLAVTYTVNGGGGIDVLANYTAFPDPGSQGDYNWATPGAFGNINEVLLLQAVQDSYTGGLAKWTNFELVPEPGSLLALCSGLIGLGGLALRRH